MSELAALGLLATPANPKPPFPTFDDFVAMKTLAAAVKEALRLLPVSSMLSNTSAKMPLCMHAAALGVPAVC